MATTPLLPGQFELGGLVFGRAEDHISVLSGGWDRRTYDTRSQDVMDPVGDSVLFGRDRLSPQSWSFNLLIHDDVEVRPYLAQLASVWRGDQVRGTPGAVSALRYNEHGRTSVVYGRPRRISWAADDVADPTFRLATVDFQLSDVNVYSDELTQISLDLKTTATTAGLLLPFVLPAILGESSASERRGVVTVGGSVATPVVIRITGPLTGQASDVTLYTDSWRLQLLDPVRTGDTIVINTRDGTMYRNGQPFAGVTRDSSLNLRVPPGATEMVLTAADSTATLTATVGWRSADPLI